MAAYTRTLNLELNRLAKTLLNGVPQLHEQGAANVWAATSGLGLQGALNKKAGTTGLGLRAVCNLLGSTTNQDEAYALSQVATPAIVIVGPQTAATREEIIAWLEDNGAPLESEALQELTTDELLALVEDLTNEERP